MEDIEKCSGPLTIALQYNDLFDLNSISTSTNTEALAKGRAFSLMKAVQTVNQRLVEQNKTEALLFEVILIANECPEEIKVQIVESVKHYGFVLLKELVHPKMKFCHHLLMSFHTRKTFVHLQNTNEDISDEISLEIGKFYFCKKEELINTLQSNKVKLFLSTDRDDVCKALHTGFPAALLHDQADHHVLAQLKVIFSGDIIGFSEDSLDSLSEFGFSEAQIETFKAAKICMKEFAVLIGQMRRKFGHDNSPLRTCLLTVRGSRNICATALKTVREWGLDVDEAFCLAGAPCSPILAVVKPHILWDGGLHNMRDFSTPS